MIKVKNPETGKWMNRAEIEKVYEAVKRDICTERYVPNYKDKTNRILEQEWNVGAPYQISESEAVIRISLGKENLEAFVKDKDSILR